MMMKCGICETPITTMVIGTKGIEEIVQRATEHLKKYHGDIVRSMTEMLALLPATTIMLSLLDKFEIEDTASNYPLLEHREETMERLLEIMSKLGITEEEKDDDGEEGEEEEDDMEGYEDSELEEGKQPTFVAPDPTTTPYNDGNPT